MEWQNKISRIVVLNLPERDDRLLDFAKQAEQYNIPYERISAIKDTQGAKGLRDTMVLLFNDCISMGLENCLVFEDDAEIVASPPVFDDTMNKVVSQLPGNYWMCFLGCQITGSISHYHSPNVIQATMMFSTHAVLYSLQGMKEIAGRDFKYPIDNFYVSDIERYGHSYCTYPLLCSQKPGYSDICQNEISWVPFIDAKYQQKINEFHARG